jgi:hypothetical protein
MYEDSAFQTMEKVGQQLGVSRVRIHQMLNLLKLDQRIIDYIQNITNPRQSNFWNEHRLRNIATLPKEKQYDKFHRILNRV